MPLEEVSRETISHLIGYVGQNPFIFAGTIEENICYGAAKWLPEDVRRAAQLAEIHDEILAMPDKYDSAGGRAGAEPVRRAAAADRPGPGVPAGPARS